MTPEMPERVLDSVWLGMCPDGRPTGSIYEYDPSGIREEGTVEYFPASRVAELEKEVGRLREALNNARLNLRAIAEVTECIGLDRRHVDFNCIHCFSLQAGMVAEMVLDHPSAIAAARAALADGK